MVSLGQLNLHFLNNPSELSVNAVCDSCLAMLDTTVVHTITGIRNELLLLASTQSPSPPPSIATFSFLLSDFYLFGTVQKIDKKVTSSSNIQMKALLHCLQLTMGETPLLLFPKAESLREGTSNALEALLQYDGSQSPPNTSTCIVGPFLVDVYGLLQLTSTLLHLGKVLVDYHAAPLAPTPATGPADDLPPFLQFDVDLRAMLQNIRLLNLVTNEGTIRLNDISTLHIPSVTITNSEDHSDECFVIVKQFYVDLDKREDHFLEVSDVYVILNCQEKMITMSTGSVDCLLTSQRVELRRLLHV